MLMPVSGYLCVCVCVHVCLCVREGDRVRVSMCCLSHMHPILALLLFTTSIILFTTSITTVYY